MTSGSGREVKLSNRDKVFWPESGFTKGDLIDYYAAIAATMVPHLAGRPITLRRWPNGIEGQTWFQKNAPKGRPDWMATVHLGDVDYLRIDEPDGLVWAANSAAIEIHPGLATATDLERPTSAVFDLDPGEGADMITCCRVALILRGYLERLNLEAWPKTSGSKGLQLYVPLNNATTFERTRPFAESLAHVAEGEYPDLITSTIEKVQRRKKVLIDWAQNAPSRTTVAVYSVRARAAPTVSTPVTWDEVESAETAEDLRFDTAAVLERVDRLGDLMAPVLSGQQDLPDPV
ncbi:MAG TPA: non-homologous end-joining DNA ligase [Acidimicrobiales bacterium]|jgi:bifunctional non-homologous end joining protein LigD|nr:non-homologous end-joining DNA ligase [Acidimicrobiales bacterium]